MSYFFLEADGERIQVFFSLIRNARWVGEDQEIISFDYLDHLDISVYKIDLDVDESEYGREVWNMLLQVTNLDAS